MPITEEIRHKRFLGYGYFAPELPPCFDSQGLALHRNALLPALLSVPATSSGKPAYQKFRSEKITFLHPRYRNTDRPHSIINPISYFFISHFICTNYGQLRKVERKSKISLSQSFFDRLGARPIRRPLFSKRDSFISSVSTRFEYVAQTDIRAFYHSIYTHSLPWAIHGKANAKKNPNDLKLIGNLLDLLVRNAQSGQTIGLPVGPDTSRILAEVVAAAIDSSVTRYTRINKGNGARFVDDYTFGCNSMEEGRRIISLIRKAAGDYELDVGREKTKIEPTDHLNYVGWQDFLKSHIPAHPDMESFNRFFYACNVMTKAQPELNIDKYSLQACRAKFVTSSCWPYIQEHLVSTYRRNSSVIEPIVEIILARHFGFNDIDRTGLQEFLVGRLPILAEQRRHGEAIWLLYLCKSINLPLPFSALAGFISDRNACTDILLMHLLDGGLIQGKFDVSVLRSAPDDALTGDLWLYYFEALARGWVNDDTLLERNPLYAPLFAHGIRLSSFENRNNSLEAFLKDRMLENRIKERQEAQEDAEEGDNSGIDFELSDEELAELDAMFSNDTLTY